jgi:hypothetical protein
MSATSILPPRPAKLTVAQSWWGDLFPLILDQLEECLRETGASVDLTPVREAVARIASENHAGPARKS